MLVFVLEKTDLIRNLSGFIPHRHHAPFFSDSKALAFARSIAQPELAAEATSVLTALRKHFSLRRRDIVLTLEQGYGYTFLAGRVDVSLILHPQNKEQYVIQTLVFPLSLAHARMPAMAKLIGGNAVRLEYRPAKLLDMPKLVDLLEDHFQVDNLQYPPDMMSCILQVPGAPVTVTFEPNHITFQGTGPQTADLLLDAFTSIQPATGGS